MLRLALVFALIVSLAVNVWLVSRERNREAAPRPGSAAVGPSPSAVAAESRPAPASSPAGSAPSAAEFRTLRQRLDALGLPPDIVRAMLEAAIHRSFDRRTEALVGQPAPGEYWRVRTFRPDLTLQTAMRDLQREQRQVLREVVGNVTDGDEEAEARQFGSLPSEKVARLKKIFADYSDLEEQLFADGADRTPAENRARSDLLAREKRSDLERLLTAEELLQYDLRNSPASHRLRNQLGQFEATEAEFLALYPSFKDVLDAAANNPVNTRGTGGEMRRAREATEQQLDAALKRVLGEARYAELKEANDYQLRQTKEFTAGLNLPPAAAGEVVAVQREIAPKLMAVDRDRDLTPNQRDARAAVLAGEARDRLLRVLGPENLEAYKRRGGGWLAAALNRTPAP